MSMPEDTDPTQKTHVYNSSWTNQSQPRPINPYLSNNPVQKDDQSESNFPKKLLKASALIFGIITMIFIFIVFILPVFIKSGGVTGSSDNVLVYWGVNEDEGVMNVIISDFERDNPNIKVSYAKQDPTDYRERLTTRVKNGTGPDIFTFHNSWYPMISDILSPLPSNIIDPQDLQKDYYPIAAEDLVKNGKVYGLPLEMDTLSLFVNTKIFSDGQESYPKTWQEFIDGSAKLTKRDENGRILTAGAAMGTYNNVDHAPDIISLLFVQNGVDLHNIQKSKTKTEDAIQFYKNFALVENSVWDSTLDKSLLAFSQGKVAMVFGYAKDFVSLKKQNPSIPIKVIPAPQLYAADKKNIGSYWVEGISAKSKNIEAAQAFINYLSRPDVLEKIYLEDSKTKGYGRPYPIKVLSSKIQDIDYSVFLTEANSAKSTPFVDATFDNGINDNLGNLLRDIISSDSFGQAATDKLFKDYSQILGKYSSGL